MTTLSGLRQRALARIAAWCLERVFPWEAPADSYLLLTGCERLHARSLWRMAHELRRIV